jgi:hypothetical protein
VKTIHTDDERPLAAKLVQLAPWDHAGSSADRARASALTVVVLQLDITQNAARDGARDGVPNRHA